MKKFKKMTSFVLAFVLIFTLTSINSSVNAVEYAQTVYEAENATLYGVSVNNDHTGYVGTGFVDSFDSAGDYIEFSISIPSDGDYSAIIRYANAGGYYASAKVYFDGNYEATAVFAPLNSWDVWGTAEVGNYLTAGAHTVRIAYNNHAINVDNLTIEEKHESIRSLYISNWDNMMGIWQAAQLCTADNADQSPGLKELRINTDWTANQIKDYTGFFRDETEGNNYASGEKFESEGFFDENGLLRTNYLRYDGAYTGLDISRDYAALPHMNVIVVRYVVKNNSLGAKTVKVLDMLNPSNDTESSISASYDSTRNAIIFDRSSVQLPYIALGAFSAPSGYQVGNDADSSLSSNYCSAWYTFNNNGTVKNNSSVTATSVSGAFLQELNINAGETKEAYFYIAIGDSSAGINSILDTVRAHIGSYWIDYTSSCYASWFSGAKDVPDFPDNEVALMYKRNLVMIKNTLRPGSTTGDGAHVATTNPFNYGYKVWTRDASVTAIALDAAGFLTEGEQYWRWLAARQLTTGENAGSFNTCIDVWTNQVAQFIEPEHDTIGWFLYGVYRHCIEANSNQLRDDLWPQLLASANYVVNNIDTNGFGPSDFSIFEDMDNYGVYTYTQALYVAGLEAMAKMAAGKGLNSLADTYNGAASTIKSAINRDDTQASGLWYPKGGYFDKDIRWDNSVSRIKDGSGLVLFTTGVIDIESSRASSTIVAYERDLLDDEYGMARYATDTYYSKDSVYSPSGDEAVEVSPSWPQISNWNAICSTYLGNSQKAENIFNWDLHRTAAGYMFTGECVSDVTEKPCVSTATEPTTAASFILAALVWNGDIDMRIIPDRSNAGCYRQITVSDGCSGDWTQYQYVPYYLDEKNDAVSEDLSIKKVYIANDDDYLYLRIDNESGTLPGYNESPVFQVSAHFQDVSGVALANNYTLNGTTSTHGFSFAITRSSNSNTIDKYCVGANGWYYSEQVSDSKIEWETSGGRIEMKIPFSAIGISEIGEDNWIDTIVTVGNNGTDSDTFEVHYRLTSENQQWLYGDFE